MSFIKDIRILWWAAFSKKNKRTEPLIPTIYNYVKLDPDDNYYFWMIITNFERVIDYGLVGADQVTKEQIIHTLSQNFKPIYYEAFGNRYKMVNYIWGEKEMPRELANLREGFLKNPYKYFDSKQKLIWFFASIKGKFTMLAGCVKKACIG